MKDLNWVRVFAALALPVLIIVIVYQITRVDVNYGLFFFSILALIIDGIYLWDFMEDDDVDYF
jgi:hypothetical protein